MVFNLLHRRRRRRQKRRQLSSLLFWGMELFHSMPHNKFTAIMICRNGRIEKWTVGGKMEDLPDHTTPNHHPPKLDVFPKCFLQIILMLVLLVWYSSMSHKQQGQLLPYPLSYSSFMICWFVVFGLVAFLKETAQSEVGANKCPVPEKTSRFRGLRTRRIRGFGMILTC